MTMESVRGKDDAQQKAEEREPSYTIDPGMIEAQGRSAALVVGERLCEAARAKLKPSEGKRPATYKELRQLARHNCAGQEGYLLPQQPVLETVFRMLLAAPKDAMSVSTIHDELSDLWVRSPWPRHIARESLRRVLDHAARYGIVSAAKG